ncbi:translation initiation factor IF-2 N-terminal domain-containing protein, partial [uncultured Selenomonas sp.]
MSESKYRITDLAKEFKTDKNTIIDILKSKNYKVKNMFSAVGEEERAAVKAELGRTAKPVRRESMQSKAPAPQQERLAKKDVRPAAPAQKDGESAASAGRAEIPAPEKQVLRARTKAPGIVIVRQAPAKTRSESSGASNAGSARPARSSSAGGNAGGHSSSGRPAGRAGAGRPSAPAAMAAPPPAEGRETGRRRSGRGGENTGGGDR